MNRVATGLELHAIATGSMQRWAEHPKVNSDQLRSAIAQVKADLALYESESNALKAEYLMLRNTLALPDFGGIVGLIENLAGDIRPAWMRSRISLMICEPELFVRLSRHVLANQIRDIDKPLPNRPKLVGIGTVMLFDTDPTVTRALGELDANQIGKELQKSVLSRELLSATKSFDNAFLRFRARQAALEVLLAAQAYRREKGEFPESLDDLVPQYFDSVPLDPCDRNGGRLLYRRDSTTNAVVWSVGDDGADHQGDVDSSASNRPADVGFLLK
ncbi:MAG: hypothetical protein H7062_16460 [Candidatus Saccharimonas sp.]|nr:hypothetical protein [Planctomycetaceae bacterium]